MPKNFCQNPLCHLDNTKDRLKKGKYQTRKANSSWYNYFCTQICFNQYFSIHKDRIVNFIGLKTEPSFRDQNDQNIYSMARDIRNRPDYNWNETNISQIIYNQIEQN